MVDVGEEYMDNALAFFFVCIPISFKS